MNSIKHMMSLLLLLGIAGCAAMNETECRVGDWYGSGLRDGQAGTPNRVAEYADSCSKLGILPVLNDYYAGHNQGLLSYCSPENGYRVGLSGASYGNVCAPELQAQFLREYQRGWRRYQIETEIRDLEYKISSAKRERKALEEKIAKAVTEDERRALLRELKQLSNDELRWQSDLYRYPRLVDN